MKPIDSMVTLPIAAKFGTMPPPAGLHTDIPAADYHRWDACSQSRLKTLAITPASLLWEMTHPTNPTDDMKLGNATHTLTLQPDLFDRQYVVSDRCAAERSAGGRCRNPGKFFVSGEWRCGTHVKAERYEPIRAKISFKLSRQGFKLDRRSESGSYYYKHADGRRIRLSDHAPSEACLRRCISAETRLMRYDLPPYGSDDPRIVLTAGEYEATKGMRESVLANESARLLLEADGEVESSGVYVDPLTGQICKFRADKIVQRADTMGDLKTTVDASPYAFSRSIFTFGYHIQAAHYLIGSEKLGRPLKYFTLIVVEKTPPYLCAVYRLVGEEREHAIPRGREDRKRLIETYHKCMSEDVWPAYGNDVMDIDLPHWA